MSLFRVFVVAALGVRMLSSAGALAASSVPIEITACGQHVPLGRTGFLSGDLDCPTNDNTVGVALGRKAKLDLRGFTLTGGDVSVGCEPLTCDTNGCRSGRPGRCEVFGGTITGASRYTVTGGSVTLRNVTIVDGGNYAVLGYPNVDVFDSQILDTRLGLQGRRVRVYNTTLDGAAINGTKVRLTSSSVTNNVNYGIVGTDIRLFSSSVTGNGSTCPPDLGCADLYTVLRPKLDATSTCETSRKIDGGLAPWGVCTLD